MTAVGCPTAMRSVEVLVHMELNYTFAQHLPGNQEPGLQRGSNGNLLFRQLFPIRLSQK